MQLTLDEVIEQVKQWVENNASYSHIWLLRDYKDDELPIRVRDVFFLPNQHTIVVFSYNDYFVIIKYENEVWTINKYSEKKYFPTIGS